MVSSTCSDAFRKSLMSNDPEKEDRDLLRGEDRFVALLLGMVVALRQDNDAGFMVGSKPPSSIVFTSAFVARSLR